MKKITILSGKGGVGKSSITASLAVVLSKNHKIITADCDVDASNLALVFGLKEKDYREWKPLTTNKKPTFDLKKCNSCKKCFKECYFNAIEWVNNKPMLNKFGCEGCRVCEIVCPVDAIKLTEVKNAKIGYANTKYGFNIVSAQLEIGESGSGKIVAEVKKLAGSLEKDSEIMLIDSAAGIGCPVIASVTGSDYVIAVTEPTPSGFSDMKRALEVVEHFKIPYSIIINKYDINVEYLKKIEKYADKNKIKILAKIPYSKSFVDALVNLEPVVVYDRKFSKLFKEITKKLRENLR